MPLKQENNGKIFLGQKVNESTLSWQKIALNIDQWLIGQENTGKIGDELYLLDWIANDLSIISQGCYRQIYAPRNNLQRFLEDNKHWECILMHTEGEMSAKLSSIPWNWSKKVSLDWKDGEIYQFTKL